MIKKRRLLVMLYIFTCISIITTSVLAAFNFEKVMVSIVAYSGDGNAKYVVSNDDGPVVSKKGVKVIIGLSVNAITGTEKGISSIDGYFNYNKNIFETLNPETDIKVENGSFLYNEETNKIAIDYVTPITDTIQIVMNLKTKTDISLGTYTNAVRFDNMELATVDSGVETFSIAKNVQIVSSYDNRNDVTYTDENFNIIENYPSQNETENTVTNETNEIENNVNETNTVDNTITNTMTNETTNEVNNKVENNVNTNTANQIKNNVNTNNAGRNNTVTNTNKDDTISKNPLPNTGIEKIAIPTLLALIIVSIVFYNKYNKLKGI